jgi:hypothetical protein
LPPMGADEGVVASVCTDGTAEPAAVVVM